GNFAGQPGGDPAYPGFPNDVAPANAHLGAGGISWTVRARSVYDATKTRWIHPRSYALYDRTIAALPTTGVCDPAALPTPILDGCAETLATPLKTEFRSIAFRRTIDNKELIYYCSSRTYPPAQPTDDKLYAINLTDTYMGAPYEEALPWPVPSLRCEGSTL